METNEKKQKTVLKCIVIFVILTLVILLAELAWAKYQTVRRGGTNAQVAVWYFDLQNCEGKSATVKGINFPITRNDGNTSVASEKLAPGTSGEFKMIVDTTKTQVLTMYNIKINLTDCPTNLKFYTDSDMKQELSKVEIGQKEENGETVKIHQLNISRFLSLDEVDRKHPETLYWRWLMETGDTDEQKYANNLEDSLWMNKGKMTMDITAIGEQVIEVPSQIAIRSINVENSNGSTSTATIDKATTELADGINANIVLGPDSNATSTINVTMTNLSDEIYYFYDAKLVSAGGEEIDSASIDYEIIGLTKSRNTTIGTELIPGSTVDFKITVKLKDGIVPNNNTGVLNTVIKFELRQVYNINYASFYDITDFPNKVIDGGTITINMPTKIAKVKVTNNNALMIQDNGYTYNDNILTIPNVQGNIGIEDTGLRKFEGVNNGIAAFATRETSTGDNYGDFEVINNIDPSENLGVPYNDNDGKLKYNQDNSLELDVNNAIAGVNVANVNLNDEYSIYVTVKGNTNQHGSHDGRYAATILAISEQSGGYLTWLGFLDNYFNVHSFCSERSYAEKTEMSTIGFASFPISEYSDKILNIQITAVRGGTTKVYFNGVKVKEFPSGENTINYKSIIIGDLRKGRGLKFTGNIYDVAFYSRALTYEEVKENWQHAQKTWNIEQ